MKARKLWKVSSRKIFFITLDNGEQFKVCFNQNNRMHIIKIK